MASLMSDAWLFRRLRISSAPLVFHLTNILLHAANTVLVLLILRRLGATMLISGAVALLFAWHPMQVESVAWIAQRKTVLATFFALLSMLAYLRLSDGRRWAWLPLA